MINKWKSALILVLALFCTACPDEPDDNPECDGQEIFEPISASMEIGPYGGDLELSDEKGNKVKVTIPPAALADTVSVTLTIQGEWKSLPIETRVLRPFTLEPEDLNLYQPALLSIEYATVKDDIEAISLFRIRNSEHLSPLMDHQYPEGSRTVMAATLSGGEYAEGDISREQLVEQFEQLNTSLGIAGKSVTEGSDCNPYKAKWDAWRENIGAYLRMFQYKLLKGYYDDPEPGEKSMEEDFQWLCDQVVSQAAKEILGMGTPADACCRDYTHTILRMMESMMLLGCEGSTYDQVSNRVNDVLIDCKTWIVINTILNASSEGGEMKVETSGIVPLTIKFNKDGTATVSGTGTLMVTGSVTAGGPCKSTISGTTTAEISGNRDAAYFYDLSINTNQNATMVTVCPEYNRTDQLGGSGTQKVVLSPYNGYSISIEESVDGGGTFSSEITLMNPYTEMPEAPPVFR